MKQFLETGSSGRAFHWFDLVTVPGSVRDLAWGCWADGVSHGLMSIFIWWGAAGWLLWIHGHLSLRLVTLRVRGPPSLVVPGELIIEISLLLKALSLRVDCLAHQVIHQLFVSVQVHFYFAEHRPFLSVLGPRVEFGSWGLRVFYFYAAHSLLISVCVVVAG